MYSPGEFGRVRSRPTGADAPAVGGTERFYLSGNLFQTTQVGGAFYQGRETTWDALHPTYVDFMNAPARFRKSAYNSILFRYILKTGGNFRSTKSYYVGGGGTKLHGGTTGPNRVTYDGTVVPVQPSIVEFVPDPTSDSFLSDLGAKQILYNLPTQPLVGIGQTLAELKREGIPHTRSLGSFRSYSPRKGGEDYLNWQFGFRPVIQDIYDLANSIDTADKQWRSYVKGASKLQRRHFEFPTIRSSTTTTVASPGSSYPLLPTTIASGQSSPLYRTRSVVTKRRFSAAYAYALPQGSQSTIAAVRKVKQYQQQYGLNIDPLLLWELTPWSWLIDWFLPIGNFVESVSGLILGNTALPWAFISEHSVITDTYERPGFRFVDGSTLGTFQVVYDYKRRLAANPLGFGVNWADLSPKQLSILAAIGITR